MGRVCYGKKRQPLTAVVTVQYLGWAERLDWEKSRLVTLG